MKRLIPAIILAVLVLTASKPVKVACIGDSITAGVGVKDPATDSYPAVLQTLLGSGYEVRNFGFSARTLLMKGDRPYMKEQMFADVKDWMPDVVTIMLGTNDTKPVNWAHGYEFEADYVKMIDELRALPTHPKIYVCLPPPIGTNRYTINDSTAVSGVMPVVKKVADRRWCNIVNPREYVQASTDFFPDGVHPNEAGARMIAQAIFDCLDEYGDTGVQGKRIVFMGDSITDGFWGRADSKPSLQRDHYDKNHIYGHSYMSNSAAWYQAKYPERRYKFYNRGIGGGTLRQMAERWDTDVIALHPDVLSILVGVNDANGNPFNLDFAAWEKLYRSLLDRALEANPDVKFVLCTPFLLGEGAISRRDYHASMKSEVVRLSGIVRQIAKDYGAVLVPFDKELERLCKEDRAHDAQYWIWDGVHPTYAAHAKLSELWVKSTKKIMK